MISPPRPVEPPVGEASAPFWRRPARSAWSCSGARRARGPSSTHERSARSASVPRSSGADSQGRGRIDAFTVEHRPQPSFADEPYVIALVDLADGVRMMTNIVGCRPEEVRVGMEVVVSWSR